MKCKFCHGDGCDSCRRTRVRSAEAERALTIMQLDLNTGKIVPAAQPRSDKMFYVKADGIIFSITKREDGGEGIEVAVSGLGDSRKHLLAVYPRSGNVVRLSAVDGR